MNKLVDLVKEDVTFQFYRDGSLFYKTSSGFMFAVPIDDAGSGTFKAADRGIFFMRWIRKAHREVLEEQTEAILSEEAKMQGDGYLVRDIDPNQVQKGI